MIIMINGAFGVGKSTVAELLCRRISNAFLYDPEYIGPLSRRLTEGIRSNDEETDDFQDIRLWPALAAAAGRELYLTYRRPMIVPMTLANQIRLALIRSEFESVSPVLHFCLLASWPVIQQRLRQRGDDDGSWSWRKSEAIAPALFNATYAMHINTDQRTPDAIVDELLQNVR